jgi:hypothetical protein
MNVGWQEQHTLLTQACMFIKYLCAGGSRVKNYRIEMDVYCCSSQSCVNELSVHYSNLFTANSVVFYVVSDILVSRIIFLIYLNLKLTISLFINHHVYVDVCMGMCIARS